MSQTQKRMSDSTDTDSDSETEMTVIRPKLHRKMRLGSQQSYGSYGKALSSELLHVTRSNLRRQIRETE